MTAVFPAILPVFHIFVDAEIAGRFILNIRNVGERDNLVESYPAVEEMLDLLVIDDGRVRHDPGIQDLGLVLPCRRRQCEHAGKSFFEWKARSFGKGIADKDNSPSIEV